MTGPNTRRIESFPWFKRNTNPATTATCLQEEEGEYLEAGGKACLRTPEERKKSKHAELSVNGDQPERSLSTPSCLSNLLACCSLHVHSEAWIYYQGVSDLSPQNCKTLVNSRRWGGREKGELSKQSKVG